MLNNLKIRIAFLDKLKIKVYLQEISQVLANKIKINCFRNSSLKHHKDYFHNHPVDLEQQFNSL